MNKLFTYGTLKRGHNNHDLLKGSKYLGDFDTGPGYRKITKGLPYLIIDPDGPGCSGEVFLVSDLTLKLVDRLEGSPTWYVRTMIKVFRPDKDLSIDAWCYLMPKERV